MAAKGEGQGEGDAESALCILRVHVPLLPPRFSINVFLDAFPTNGKLHIRDVELRSDASRTNGETEPELGPLTELLTGAEHVSHDDGGL